MNTNTSTCKDKYTITEKNRTFSSDAYCGACRTPKCENVIRPGKCENF